MMKRSMFVALLTSAALGGCATSPEDADLSSPDTDDSALGSAEQQSTCGAADESQYVNSYNGALGPSVAFVQANKSSKGGLASSSGGVPYCSGTMIGTNLFLTAGSCIGANMTGHAVVMNYEYRADGTALPAAYFPVTAVLETESSVTQQAEYAILSVSGSPGTTYGTAKFAGVNPGTGGSLTLMSHPNGNRKKIEAGTVLSYYRDTVRYADLDTQTASAGGSLLDYTGRIAGVHTHGGCTATGGYNYGTKLTSLRTKSPIIGADCVFEWAEGAYASSLSPAGQKNTYGFLNGTPFVYRYYAGTNSYIGLNLGDQHVYFLGSNGVLQDQGTLAALRTAAACQ